jgi:GntR family negative regulator for fad regulon and positive regulator of fabA
VESQAIPGPALRAERALLQAILDGAHAPGATLPAERELALRLGVTRPTLREALQRLHRDGWLRIRHGRSTVVADFWREGGLNVLEALVRQPGALPEQLVERLLEVRRALAPAYARAAVLAEAAAARAALHGWRALPDDAAAFASFDWRLHHALTVASGNPIYTWILNGFAGLYERKARAYFASEAGRTASRRFYAALQRAAARRDAAAAERVTRRAMEKSLRLWRRAAKPARR